MLLSLEDQYFITKLPKIHELIKSLHKTYLFAMWLLGTVGGQIKHRFHHHKDDSDP